MARVPETKQESVHLSLSCLGWPRLHITGGQEIRLPSSRKAIALLLYLFHHPTVHARSTIACLLWSEVTESKSKSSLRRALYQLQQSVPDLIEVTRNTVSLAKQLTFSIDSIRCQTLLEGDEIALREGIHLYQQPFLDGFSICDGRGFEEWQQTQHDTLHRGVLHALEGLLNEAEEREDQVDLRAFGERIIELDPWNEYAYRTLILWHLESGQRSEAQRLYERCFLSYEQELHTSLPPSIAALEESIQAPHRANGSEHVKAKESEIAQDIKGHSNDKTSTTYREYLHDVSARYGDLFTKNEDLHTYIAKNKDVLQRAWCDVVLEEEWTLAQKTLWALYKFFTESSRFAEGVTWFSQTLKQTNLTSNSLPFYAQLLASYAGLLRRIGAFQEGIRLSTQSVALCQRMTLPKVANLAWSNHGSLQISLGDYGASRNSYKQALELAKHSLPAEWQIRPLINLGSTCMRMGELKEAREWLLQAKLLSERSQLSFALTHTNCNLGLIAMIEGRFEESSSFLSASLSQGRGLGYHHIVAVSLENLSELALRQQEYERAIDLGLLSLRGWEALKDEGGILRVQAQLSLCWWRLGDRAKALPLRRRCLEQLSRKDYPIDMIVCLFYFAMQLCDEDQSLAVSLATFILDKHTIELLYERELRKLLAQCADIRPPSSAPDTLQGWLLELQLLPSM